MSEERNIERKHAVNVLFPEEEYAKLVRKAAELTLQEGRRVSVANLVRRLAFPAFRGEN